MLDGRQGSDKLELRVTGAAPYNEAPKLSNIETVQVTAVGTGGTTIDLVSATGVTKVVSESGSDATTFNNLKNFVDVEINNSTAGAQQVTYAASVVTGTDDAQKIAFNSATVGAVAVGAGAGTGIETLNISATGKNTAASVTSGAKTVNITGEGGITITAAISDATTIDGSKAKGDLKFGIDATKVVTAKGGEGNDTITVAGLTKDDSIDGGAGTDFVAFANTTAAPTAKVTNLVNFEGVQIDTQAVNVGTVDVDFYSGSTVNSFKIGTGASDATGITTGTVNITNAATGAAVTLYSDTNANGAVSFALKTNSSADVLNVNLVNVDTTITGDAHGLATLTAAQVETLNINASNQVRVGTTYPADTLQISTLSAAAATTLIIAGDSAVSLGSVGSTLTALTKVDASTMTKAVTLGAVATAFGTDATGATVTTGSGDDLVHLGVGATGVLKAVDLGSQTATGAGDTLVLSGGGALTGVTIADLSSTTDQVQQLLGSANAAAQLGLENINLAGLNGSAQIVGSAAANTIIGTAGNDTISAGAGNDTITGGLGGDTIDGGAGNDTYVYNTAAADSLVTSLTSFDKVTVTSGDKFDAGATVLTAGTYTAGAQTTTAIGTAVNLLSALTEVTQAGTTALTANAAYIVDITDTGSTYAGKYLVIESGGVAGTVDAADTVIQLIGVTGTAALTASGGDLSLTFA